MKLEILIRMTLIKNSVRQYETDPKNYNKEAVSESTLPSGLFFGAADDGFFHKSPER